MTCSGEASCPKSECRAGGCVEEAVEIVPLDEPSIEDYPDGLIQPDEFGAPPVKVVPVIDGVRDTRSR
jgi:hypothetical protein